MANLTAADAARTLEVAIFVPDALLQESLASSIENLSGDASPGQGVRIVELRKSKAFGSFDLPFYVSLVLSVPIGVGSSLVATWLWQRINTSANAGTATAIKVQIASQTIMVAGRSDAEVVEITHAIEVATNLDDVSY